MPEDVAELVVYSQLSAARGRGDDFQSGPAGRLLRLLRDVPDEAADLIVGASVVIE